ncbi:MAG: TonB family protein [Lentisphaerae bacterium]|nr:TonB family protein [Lentisphaerota bacterium]
MSNSYLRNTMLSVAVHLFCVYALIAFSFASCRARPAPRDLMFFVAFQPGPPALPALETLRLQETGPKPADTLTLIPEPTKTDSVKAAKKTKVDVKTNIVRQAAASKVKHPVKKMSKEQIRSILESAVARVGPAPAGTPEAGAGSGNGQATPYGWYLEQVRAIMYEAWQQPSALAGQQGLFTQVRLRVRQDGQITSKEMAASSGNRLMDDSVMLAVESVVKLPELPFGFGGAYKDLVIDFELEETSQ